MKQNAYDDPGVFQNYSKMPRSVGGLEGAEEWPSFCALLPELRGKSLLDLGCGYGWHCRYARDRGARSVVGTDLSARMLERARALTPDKDVIYHLGAIEDLEFANEQFDVVISSLALHYVKCFHDVCQRVVRWLVGEGDFVFSVEHPLFTSLDAQEWCLDGEGRRLHWPVDNYEEEGPRFTNWMDGNVIKYHRTIGTYVNSLIDSGFHINRLLELSVSPERVSSRPDLKDERRRPIFLLIAAHKVRKTSVFRDRD